MTNGMEFEIEFKEKRNEKDLREDLPVSVQMQSSPFVVIEPPVV